MVLARRELRTDGGRREGRWLHWLRYSLVRAWIACVAGLLALATGLLGEHSLLEGTPQLVPLVDVVFWSATGVGIVAIVSVLVEAGPWAW